MECNDGDILDNWLGARDDFEKSGREKLDRRLDEVLRKSAFQQSPEAAKWMTEEERRSIAWFDLEEYDNFMMRSAWYDGDGWIIPYYRKLCEEQRLASPSALTCCSADNPVGDPDADMDSFGCRTDSGNHTREERFQLAVDKILSAAEAGDPRAMNVLGTFCEMGVPRSGRDGFERHDVRKGDFSAALSWYRKSAERGCVQGQSNYARCLLNKIGAEGDELYGREAFERAVELYRDLAMRGSAKAQYRLVCLYGDGRQVRRDVPECAKWLRMAAQSGHKTAASVVAAAGDDTSDERLCAELMVFWQNEWVRKMRDEVDYSVDNVSYSLPVGDGHRDEEEVDKQLDELPEGTVLPPSSGRERVRVPNLTSANPSFAARLIIMVRDRFGGDAPSVYKAAHVSRQTYSSIVSNELRPVSKETAVAFALALRLAPAEVDALLESAGFSLSRFLIEDIVVRACILAGIYDIDRVNAVLAAHGARTFKAE